MLRIICISDLHNGYGKLNIPECDILLCTGDVSNRGFYYEIRNFLDWFQAQTQAKHKVFIAGNHDFFFQESESEAFAMVEKYRDVTYLQNDTVEIEGIRIFGSPNQPWYHDWAFNFSANPDEYKYEAQKLYKNIHKADIVLTHGPPYGILDKSRRGNLSVGCPYLLEAIQIDRPALHVFGHIHEDHGVVYKHGTLHVNAAINNFGDTPHSYIEVIFDKHSKKCISFRLTPDSEFITVKDCSYE